MTTFQCPRQRRGALKLIGSWALGLGICAVSANAHDPISTKVTWAREIAPLIERRCTPCHTRSGFAFPLTAYEDARPWAVAIKEEVLAGHMPPWGAARGIGQFANDRSLTRHEMELIAAWVDGGAPRQLSVQPAANTTNNGVASNTPAPTPRRSPQETARQPGTLIPLANAVVEDATQRAAGVGLQVPAGFSLTGWTFEPGASAIVERVDLELGTRWLGTWTPGDRPIEFPDDAGMALGGNALFTARIAYRAPARPVTDHSAIRIWMTKEPLTRTVREATVIRSWRTVNAVQVFGVRPTGTGDVEAVARYADGAIEPLGVFIAPSRAPHPTYRLARPLALPAGARIEVSGAVRLLYTDGATRSVKPNVRRRPRR